MTHDTRMKSIEKVNKLHKRMVRELKRERQLVKAYKGNLPIALITSYRMGALARNSKKVCCPFAGIIKYLVNGWNCHALFVNEAVVGDTTDVDLQIKDYLKKNKIKVVLCLSPGEKNQTNVIQIEGTGDKENAFVSKLIQYTFEYQLREQMNVVERIAIDSFEKQFECVKLIVNEAYLNPLKEREYYLLIDSLSKIITTLSNIDWGATKIEAYRLGQSNKHKPQDKVEIYEDENRTLSNYSYLGLCNYTQTQEWVRMYHIKKSAVTEEFPEDMERLFLTNRLIERLFEREWIEKGEEKSGLDGAPVVLYECTRDEYEIGITKANKIENVYFSSELYNELRKESNKYEFAIFNKYTDSMLYVDFSKADYDDGGRVKGKDNKPAKKVMIPRYYKILLGYIEEPLKRIREEEYKLICSEASEDLKSDKQKCFEKCYEKIIGQPYYSLKESIGTPEETDATHKMLYQFQKEMGFFNRCEILKIPKFTKKENRIKALWKRFKNHVLNIFINKSEYLLKTVWTSETDDKNNVARLNSNMLKLMGISENDKILVRFGNHEASMRVLVNDDLTDYEIGIPAPARKELGMNTVHDIVSVHRDMVHILFRHSEAQTMTIFGTILTVSQLTELVWLRVVLSIFFAALSMYLVLNEERIKVK